MGEGTEALRLAAGGDHEEPMKPGVRVEVRRRFDQHWARGFEIAEVLDSGYRIRRLSDNSVLPEVFGPDDVRRERRREGLWWFR